jgi:signal transduction histidine kinase
MQFPPEGGRPLAEPAEFSESDLLASLSHEMRTPLSAILGFAQLMESCTPAPSVSQKRSIDLILQAGWQLEQLINMTRDLVLLQSGALSLSLDPVPLAAVMLDLAAMIEPQAQSRGICVTFPLLESPCFVLADGIRLQQALGSWLSAAIEYSEVDGTIVVDCDTRSSECIRIGISGGGGEDAMATPEMRIGVLLARRLIELMGGAIGAERHVGMGKIFSFDLKRLRVPMVQPITG